MNSRRLTPTSTPKKPKPRKPSEKTTFCGAIAELHRHEYKNPRSGRVEETSRAGRRENQVTCGDRNTDRDPHRNNTTVTGCDLHRTDSEGTKGCVGCFEVLSKPNKTGASDRRSGGPRTESGKTTSTKKSEAEAVERGRSGAPRENETKKKHAKPKNTEASTLGS